MILNLYFKLLFFTFINHLYAHTIKYIDDHSEDNLNPYSRYTRHQRPDLYKEITSSDVDWKETEDEIRKAILRKIMTKRVSRGIPKNIEDNPNITRGIRRRYRGRSRFPSSNVYNSYIKRDFDRWANQRNGHTLNGDIDANAGWKTKLNPNYRKLIRNGIHTLLKPRDEESISNYRWKPISAHALPDIKPDKIDLKPFLEPESEETNKNDEWKPMLVDSSIHNSDNDNADQILEVDNEENVPNYEWNPWIIDTQDVDSDKVGVNSLLEPDEETVSNNRWKIIKMKDSNKINTGKIDISNLLDPENKKSVTVHRWKPIRVDSHAGKNNLLGPENKETVVWKPVSEYSSDFVSNNELTNDDIKTIKFAIEQNWVNLDEEDTFNSFKTYWLKLLTMLKNLKGRHEEYQRNYLLALLESMKKSMMNNPEYFKLYLKSLNTNSNSDKTNLTYKTKQTPISEVIITMPPNNELIRKICEGVKQNVEDFWKIFYSYFGKNPKGTKNLQELEKLYLILTIFTKFNEARRLGMPIEKYVDRIIKIISPDIQFLTPTILNVHDKSDRADPNTACVNCNVSKINDIINNFMDNDKETKTPKPKIDKYKTTYVPNIPYKWKFMYNKNRNVKEPMHTIDTSHVVAQTAKPTSGSNIIEAETFKPLPNSKAKITKARIKLLNNDWVNKIKHLLKLKPVKSITHDLEVNTKKPNDENVNPIADSDNFKPKTVKPILDFSPLQDNTGKPTTNIDNIKIETVKPMPDLDHLKEITEKSMPHLDDLEAVTTRPMIYIDDLKEETVKPMSYLDGFKAETTKPMTYIYDFNEKTIKPMSELDILEDNTMNPMTNIKNLKVITVKPLTDLDILEDNTVNPITNIDDFKAEAVKAIPDLDTFGDNTMTNIHDLKAETVRHVLNMDYSNAQNVKHIPDLNILEDNTMSLMTNIHDLKAETVNLNPDFGTLEDITVNPMTNIHDLKSGTANPITNINDSNAETVKPKPDFETLEDNTVNPMTNIHNLKYETAYPEFAIYPRPILDLNSLKAETIKSMPELDDLKITSIKPMLDIDNFEIISVKPMPDLDDFEIKTVNPMPNLDTQVITMKPITNIDDQKVKTVNLNPEADNLQTIEPIIDTEAKTVKPLTDVIDGITKHVTNFNIETTKTIPDFKDKTAKPLTDKETKTAKPIINLNEETINPITDKESKTMQPMTDFEDNVVKPIPDLNNLETITLRPQPNIVPAYLNEDSLNLLPEHFANELDLEDAKTNRPGIINTNLYVLKDPKKIKKYYRDRSDDDIITIFDHVTKTPGHIERLNTGDKFTPFLAEHINDLIAKHPTLANFFGIKIIPPTVQDTEYVVQPDFDNWSYLPEIESQIHSMDIPNDKNNVKGKVPIAEKYYPHKLIKKPGVHPNYFNYDPYQSVDAHQEPNVTQNELIDPTEPVIGTSVDLFSHDSLELMSHIIVMFLRNLIKKLGLDVLIRNLDFSMIIRHLTKILLMLVNILTTNGISPTIIMKVIMDIKVKLRLFQLPQMRKCVQKVYALVFDIVTSVLKTIKQYLPK